MELGIKITHHDNIPFVKSSQITAVTTKGNALKIVYFVQVRRGSWQKAFSSGGFEAGFPFFIAEGGAKTEQFPSAECLRHFPVMEGRVLRQDSSAKAQVRC